MKDDKAEMDDEALLKLFNEECGASTVPGSYDCADGPQKREEAKKFIKQLEAEVLRRMKLTEDERDEARRCGQLSTLPD